MTSMKIPLSLTVSQFIKQVYALEMVGVCGWVFWYCEKTSVDHVTLQDSRQPWDNVSNGIKF